MAAGDTLVAFVATDNHPPASAYATPDVRNSHPVLDFDAASEESAIFSAILPRHYAGGGLTISVKSAASSATSGDVKWGTSIEAEGTDVDADSFAAESTGTGTANGTSGIETTTTTTHTAGAQMDSLAVGQRFRLKVSRKAADVADTMTGDAELTAVEIKET